MSCRPRRAQAISRMGPYIADNGEYEITARTSLTTGTACQWGQVSDAAIGHAIRTAKHIGNVSLQRDDGQQLHALSNSMSLRLVRQMPHMSVFGLPACAARYFSADGLANSDLTDRTTEDGKCQLDTQSTQKHIQSGFTSSPRYEANPHESCSRFYRLNEPKTRKTKTP